MSIVSENASEGIGFDAVEEPECLPVIKIGNTVRFYDERAPMAKYDGLVVWIGRNPTDEDQVLIGVFYAPQNAPADQWAFREPEEIRKWDEEKGTHCPFTLFQSAEERKHCLRLFDFEPDEVRVTGSVDLPKELLPTLQTLQQAA